MQSTTRLAHGPALVFATHGGDETLGCGGAILSHLARQEPVALVCLGQPHSAASPLAFSQRSDWQLGGGQLEYGEALIERIGAELAAQSIAIVYAPSASEPDAARRSVALAVMEAVRRHGGDIQLAQYEIAAASAANLLLDISNALPAKQAACQPMSADATLARQVEQTAALNRYRALTLPAPATAAEAYSVHTASTLSAAIALHAARLDAPAHPSALPLVSVLIRSADRATLGEALDSVAAQTYPHIEIVLVNVTGGAHSPLPTSHGRFPIRLVETGQPLTRPKAANAAIDHAQGDWLIFLDDDDWLEPDHIAKLVKGCQQQPAVLASYTGVRAVGPNKEAKDEVWDQAYDSAQLFLSNFLPIHAVLFSSRIKQLGCRFDAERPLYEDWDFWLQLSRHGDFRHIPGVSAVYRLNPAIGSGAHEIETRRSDAMLSLLRQWLPRASNEELARFSDEYMRGRYAGRLEESLASVDAHRQQLVQGIAQAQQQLQLVQQTADLSAQRADLLAEAAKVHEHHVNILNQTVAERSQAVQTMQGTVATLQPLIDNLQQQLAAACEQKDGQIRNLQLILHSSISEKDSVIANLQDEMHRQILGKDASISHLQGDIQQLQLETARMAAIIHQQHLQLEERQQRVNEQLATIHHQNLRIEDLNGRANGLQAALDAERHAHAVLQGSLSWRITKPLRWLSRKLRG
ncbi:glycosyltransferase [Chitinimonas sp.]|uniref:glycosyltransferase n=1 Tax=Chitinimonas sp. TaxID=1934313 RepID=UPI0035AD9CD2